jgi:large subunit ribosomal protein L4
LWRGGGVTFAARPRNYEQKLNKKMYRAAMRSIVSELVRQERLLVVEDFTMAEPKTRDLLARLKEFDLKSVLIVTDAEDVNLYLAARNLNSVDVTDVQALDPVGLVRYESVLFTRGAVKLMEAWLG